MIILWHSWLSTAPTQIDLTLGLTPYDSSRESLVRLYASCMPVVVGLDPTPWLKLHFEKPISYVTLWEIAESINHGRRKFRGQTSENMNWWKSRGGKSQRGEEKRQEERRSEKRREEERRSEKRREEERRSEKRKSQKKEDAGARKGRKVAKHCVFPMICDSGGSKSRLTKAAGAEPSGEMRDEQLHAVVARGIFRSQIVQKTPGSV